jgi:hypothetical protein
LDEFKHLIAAHVVGSFSEKLAEKREWNQEPIRVRLGLGGLELYAVEFQYWFSGERLL